MLYPMWPDGAQRFSTVVGFNVRTYNYGNRTARKLLWTFGLPGGVPIWSATGYQPDMNARVRGYSTPTVFTTTQDEMNPGVGVTHEFYVQVLPGTGSFFLEYSVALEDERAVSGRLLLELNQTPAPAGAI
jgi:hypothetical protein